eukprot:Rhum_TRINITY_DN11141_c2_g1::Rhum_TRINITY_DN11141_c2_g1_i1::g.42771::m.42771/K04739/PRKAR; cAMP-dependent protein kinase regulator
MGCGGSTEAKEHKSEEKGERPAKGKDDNKEDSPHVDPALAMQQFTFGEDLEVEAPPKGVESADNKGASGGGGGGSGHLDIGGARKGSKARRRGVSQEVRCDSDADKSSFPFHEKTPEQVTAAMKAVAANTLFSMLPEAEHSTVVGAMLVEEFEEGVAVLTQDEESTMKYYVIMDGGVEVLKKGERVCTFGAGCGFGELELMYSPICVATVKTTQPTKCLSLDRDTYRTIAVSAARATREDYTERLKAIDFLSTLTAAQFANLADSLHRQEHQDGDRIIQGGTEGEFMHIIVEGKVKVMGIADGALKEVAELSQGDTVGELEFLNAHKTVADVVASGRVVTLQLHRGQFESCLGPVKAFLEKKSQAGAGDKYGYYNQTTEEGRDAIAEQFTENFCFGESSPDADSDGGAATSPVNLNMIRRRLSSGGQDYHKKREGVFANSADENGELPPPVEKTEEEESVLRTILMEHPLFKDLYEKEISQLVAVLAPQSFAAGEPIVKQTETGDSLYVITSGDAQVTRDGVSICELHKGQSIGELELMYEQPCRATVAAKTDLQTYKID